MRVVINGHHLPGRHFEAAGETYDDVHVAVQVRRDPVDLIPGDAASATWLLDVGVTENGGLDFKGPAVHGECGERFVYLTWGVVAGDQAFTMFRRAKLMLNRIDPDLVRRAERDDMPLVASIDLTDGCGGPRCARVDPPALTWSVEQS